MERDFPIGHPAAVDYKGEKYTGPRAPWQDDYPADAKERAGANTSTADTPDGMRAAHNAWEAQQREKAAAGPQEQEHKEDFSRQDSKALLEQEAREYLKTRGYPAEKADAILGQYGVDAVLADKAAHNNA